MIKSLLAAALGVGEIVLIVACALTVVGAIVTAIVRKVKGKTDCCGDCSCCCSDCHSNSKNVGNGENN